MVIKDRIRLFVIVIAVVIGSGVPGAAQVAAPAPSQQESQVTPKVRKVPTTRPGPVSVDSQVAPQVVTILHRLNGLKMFRLLLRSGEDVKAISKLDDAFKITDEVHTNVIAGLSLDDGQTIVVWLPDAEAEMGPLPDPFAPPAGVAPVAQP